MSFILIKFDRHRDLSRLNPLRLAMKYGAARDSGASNGESVTMKCEM